MKKLVSRLNFFLHGILQVLDTRDITVKQVNNDAGEILKYSFGDAHKAFGTPLNIELPNAMKR